MIEVCELIAASLFVMLPACLVGMTREGVEESGTLLLMWSRLETLRFARKLFFKGCQLRGLRANHIPFFGAQGDVAHAHRISN